MNSKSISKKRVSLSPEMRKSIDKEIEGFVKELGGNCLSPSQLAHWIRNAAESGEIDSVYLTPLAGHPLFYRYQMVRSDEARGMAKFLTLSPRGINEFWRNEVRFVPLHEWVEEFHVYERMVQIPFFSEFKLKKSFQKWRKIIRLQKFQIASNSILDHSCLFGNRYMSRCFLRIFHNFTQLGTMGITDIPDRTTKHINDFFSLQKSQIQKFLQNFFDFKSTTIKLILDACKTTLHERGFKYEEYADELNFHLRNKTLPSSSESLNQMVSQPPRKLTFIEQANKREVCLAVIAFVRLADLVLRQTLHKLIYNSMIAIKKAIIKRAKNDPLEDQIDETSRSRSDHLAASAQKSIGSKHEEDPESEVPMFSLTIGVQKDTITHNPDVSVFLSVYQDYLKKLNGIIGEIEPMATDPLFHPFTQPFLFGRRENFVPKLESIFFVGHGERCQELLEELKELTENGFRLCDDFIEPYTETAFEFSQAKDVLSGAEDRVETDVEVLKATLSHLKRQHNSIKNIKESRPISFFKVDFRLFKRTILPNISKAITKLQESLPKVGREKMEGFNEVVRQLKEMIEFEPKTTEEYVQNMDVVERMNESFDLLETKLSGIDNVYGIMSEIPIPISADDKSNLKSLKSTMNTMALKVQDRIQAQEPMMSLFQEELQYEEKLLRQSLHEILAEVRNPSLVDTEASIEEIKPFLVKVDGLLKHSREKVERYSHYEETYGFDQNHFEDLSQAEEILKALETLWRCVEQWERFYDEWSSLNFDQLNIDSCLSQTSEIKEKIEASSAILGANAILKELLAKVEDMLENVPCLYELKKASLKDRHWRLISETVGSDIRGHKISLGFLEQSKVFQFAPQIFRIVKTAENEENLAKMVQNLEESWTNQKMPMSKRHGCSIVDSFPHLYNIINESLTTLRQLGSSQYSSQMRGQLQNWFRVVHRAKIFVDTLKEVQNMWMEQLRPCSSLIIMEECPNIYRLFSICHQKAMEYFVELEQSTSLVESFGNETLLKKLEDLKLEFCNSQSSLDAVILSLRLGSPRMFLLSRSEVLNLIDRSHNDIRAMEHYLFKMFTWFQHFVIKEGTDTIVTNRGYNPEVTGVVSTNGEEIVFPEGLKIRLEPDSWIKFLGTEVRHTMRAQIWKLCSNLHHPDVLMETLRRTNKICIQNMLVALHVSWCHFKDTNSNNWLENTIRELTTELRLGHKTPIELRRTKALLMQLHYYQQLETPALVQYHFLPSSRVVQVRTRCKSYIYGFERSCEDFLFHPMHASNRYLEQILLSYDQNFILSTKANGEVLFKDLANILGRPYFTHVPGTGTELKHEILGCLLLGAWMTIPSICSKGEETLIKDLLVKMRMRDLHAGSPLNFLGMDLKVPSGSFLNIRNPQGLLDHANLRTIGVVRPDVEVVVKWALTSKGFTSVQTCSNLVYVIKELCRFGRVDSMRKGILAIQYATKDSICHIYENFLALGGLDLIQSLGCEATWPQELTKAIQKQTELSHAVRSSLEESSLQSGDVLAANFNLLVNSLKVSSILFTSDDFSLIMKHALALLATKLKIEGNVYLQLCYKTQLNSTLAFQTLKSYLNELKAATAVLVVMGPVSEDHIEQFVMLHHTLRHIKLRVILIKSEVNGVLGEIHGLDSLTFTDDQRFIVSSIHTRMLVNEVTEAIPPKDMQWINHVAIETLHALNSVEDKDDFVFLETFSTVLACLLNLKYGTTHEHSPDKLEEDLVQLFSDALFLLLQLPKLKNTLQTISSHLEETGLIGINANQPWRTTEDIFDRIMPQHLFPQLSLDNGTADFFVPTKEIDKIARTAAFFIRNQCNVMIFGEQGCGKSIVIDKVLDILPPQTRIAFIKLGNDTDFAYEDALIQRRQLAEESLVIIQGFKFGHDAHVAYVKSLVVGRSVFCPTEGRYVELPKTNMLIEATGGEELTIECALRDLRYDVIPLFFRKSFDNDDQILSKALDVFAQDYSQEIQDEIQDLKAFLIGFHKFLKRRFPTITDHQLYRVVAGLYGASPDELSSLDILGAHVLNELMAEYSPYYQQDDLMSLVQEFSEYYGEKFFNSSIPLFSLYSSNEGGCHVEMKQDAELAKDFELAYDHIKGKLFNDQITLTCDFKTYVVQFCRSIQRFHTTMVIGGCGVGKQSLIQLSACYLDLALTNVKQDFKDALVQAYNNALADTDTNLCLQLNLGNLKEVLDTYEAFLFYFDVPHAFSEGEKEKQLFHSSEEMYEALHNSAKTDEANNSMRVLIQDHVYVIFSLDPEVFEEMKREYPYVLNKSGAIFMKEWTQETLKTIAKERLSEIKVQDVSKAELEAVFVQLHQYMVEKDQNVQTTHFLDLIGVFPKVFLPEHIKMVQEHADLQSGINRVTSANSLINQLSVEVTQKEPIILNLTNDLEGLNKRLAQEKMNLDRASKAFRRTEVAARKKSEETQELAADAHRNLEHALPSLDAASEAIGNMDRADIMEVKQMKNPPELFQQVLEAVCILMGVKADWSTAKVILGDPYFQQKLIAIDKDNIPEQISKRVRRYIDNPRFIPDEMAKVSKVACSLCMWVRAIDLYTKIFKSIEPKRIKLLQAESELAELMTALRGETDRVANIETTIGAIQTELAVKLQKKRELETLVQVTNTKLERAQVLSYSLEEECKNWEKLLTKNKESLQWLCGESIVISMMIIYSCGQAMEVRQDLEQGWMKICRESGFPTRPVIPKAEFLTSCPSKSWFLTHEYYQENLLSILHSNKWSLFIDPDDIGLEIMRDQNPRLLLLDYHTPSLVEELRMAVSKGWEVILTNMELPFKSEVQDLFEKRLYEKVHAFVGLVGIPVIRKDMRVSIGGQEVIRHPKFNLHFQVKQIKADLYLRKYFNVVAFKFEPQSLEVHLNKLILASTKPDLAEKCLKSTNAIKDLTKKMKGRKTEVLRILLSVQGSILDDSDLISALKEAKARVFETMNDLNQEVSHLQSLTKDSEATENCSRRIVAVCQILNALKELDLSFDYRPEYVFQMVESSNMEIRAILQDFVARILSTFLPSIHVKFSFAILVLLELIKLPTFNVEQFQSNFKEVIQDTTGEALNCTLAVLFGASPSVEDLKDLCRTQESEILCHAMKRLLELSIDKPMLLLTSKSGVDGLELLIHLAMRLELPQPIYSLTDEHTTFDELNHLIATGIKEQRWNIFPNTHSIQKHFARLQFPLLSSRSRVFFLTPHSSGGALSLRGKFEFQTLSLSNETAIVNHVLCDILKLPIDKSRYDKARELMAAFVEHRDITTTLTLKQLDFEHGHAGEVARTHF